MVVLPAASRPTAIRGEDCTRHRVQHTLDLLDLLLLTHEDPHLLLAKEAGEDARDGQTHDDEVEEGGRAEKREEKGVTNCQKQQERKRGGKILAPVTKEASSRIQTKCNADILIRFLLQFYFGG